MSATEVLSALDRIHGTVSVIGSMNADYTVTAQRLPGPGETITGGPLQLLPGGNPATRRRRSAHRRNRANVRRGRLRFQRRLPAGRPR